VRTARAALDGGTARGRVEEAMFRQIQAARLPNVSWREEAARWTRAAHDWSAAELDAAIRAAYDADRALKSATVSDERGLLLSLILELAARRRAA